jgi:hypothetical protein
MQMRVDDTYCRVLFFSIFSTKKCDFQISFDDIGYAAVTMRGHEFYTFVFSFMSENIPTMFEEKGKGVSYGLTSAQ